LFYNYIPPSEISILERFSVLLLSSKLNLPFLISVFCEEAVAGVDSLAELRTLIEVLIFSESKINLPFLGNVLLVVSIKLII